MMYSLKEFIQRIISSVDRTDLDIGITFELELDELCRVCDGGPQKVKFSCKSK